MVTAEWTGLAGKVADTFNEVVELNQRMAQELDRAALEASAIRFLNLEDAYVFPPNSPPFELEMVRVRLSHVGAWWPGKASPP